jgi:uncharacterized membrane protein YphA (DoxX/SURF4 family)
MNVYTRYLPALGRLLIAVLFVIAGLHKITAPAVPSQCVLELILARSPA